MNILLVTPMPPQAQPTNAVPLVTHALLSGLAARHRVTLVTAVDPDTAEPDTLEHWRSAGVDLQLVRRTPLSGIHRWQRRWRLASTWLAGKYPWRTVWFWEPGVQQRLDRLSAERPFDLLVVDDNAGGIYRYPATVPAILIEHEVRRSRPAGWVQDERSGWVRWALGEIDWQRWRSYQLNLWQKFDRIQVFTWRDASAIAAMAPPLAERVCVNPFGIALPPPADLSLEEEKTLAFVGGFSHQPNVDAARWLGEEIMPLLRVRCPGVRLLIVGSDPPQEIATLAGKDVFVLGRVPEIEPVLARAAVLLAPVRIGGGMRMKVLQGMALGKPVVTTTRGAEGLLLDQGQLPLVITDSAAAIADAVANLLASEEARWQLGHRARAFVAEHHSAAAYARRLEAIYGELQARMSPNQRPVADRIGSGPNGHPHRAQTRARQTQGAANREHYR